MQASEVLIRIARRRQRRGSGSLEEFLKERSSKVRFPNLAPILKPIRWAVIGAVATRLYMPERSTHDLDIAVHVEDAQSVRRRLKDAGFSYQGELTIGGSSWRTPDGFPIDIVEYDQPWFSKALDEAQNNLDEQGFPVIPLPYLVLMKFQAGRVQDIADVARMLGQADEAVIERTRQLFARWLPDGLEDLESLITLGKLELERG